VAYGFILNSILYTAITLIPAFSFFHDLLFYASVVVLSYTAAIITKSPKIAEILKKIGIYRNHNENIWLDVFDGENPPWLELSSSTLKTHYSGELDTLEDFSRKPIIILRKYTSYDKKGNIIKDYSNDFNFKIMIDTSQYDDIKIAYPEKISSFFGIVIEMHSSEEHTAPHFQATYRKYNAVFNMNGELTEGDMPKKQVKFIAAWTELHKDKLLYNWNQVMNKQPTCHIEPLSRLIYIRYAIKH